MKALYLLFIRFVRVFYTLAGMIRTPFARSEYCIRPGYFHRRKYHYFDDRTNTDGWQREVYQRAKDLMLKDNLRTVVDVGCGSAYKLINVLGQFQTIGVDVSPTYEWLKEKYPDRRWVKSFTDESAALRADMVVCADVIEHVLEPDGLLNYIKSLQPKWVVISTPDRNLVYKTTNFGPPGNPTHIREWSFEELGQYVAQHFEVVEHVVSNRDQATQMIVCKLKPA